MKHKILTSGRLAEEFTEWVSRTHPEIDVLLVSENQIGESIPKVNAVAGFNFLRNDLDLSHIKWIHAFGAGVDSYLSLSLPRDLILTRTTGSLGRKIGEFCLTYILSEIKAALQVYENQQKLIWKQEPTSDLNELSVLILGTGSIGQGIAQTLKGLVKEVVGLNQSGNKQEPFDQVCDWNSIPTEVDVVINALPNTPNTKSFLSEKFFESFKQVIFINVGRGDTVNEKGLIKSIEVGHISKAILDVFSTEPLPEKSELWTNENVIISPHQSGITAFSDVTSSFDKAYKALNEEKQNELFVDLNKGY